MHCPAGEAGHLGFSFDCSLDYGAGVFVGHDSQLRRQAELLPEDTIIYVVHPVGIAVFMLAAGSHSEVLRFGHYSQILIKNCLLPWRFCDDGLDCFHHKAVKDFAYLKTFTDLNAGGAGAVLTSETSIGREKSQFLHRLKSVVSLRGSI
jgi:hypothetical protein